ncbi:polysaccharide deacetylase family protein [Pedobacter sp. HMF7647]|uniref:Polysaccharide deacetylase family protein n=1 Tax=Hufsiella arboris TaxID=2695275 RepID=A0A7K1YC20_9SPHI|nr:polysaccharide deacetylase family protein [Hufsiella arboris]MXV51588.1 polysaccharide deacetylase family protein [Hufsiella arboris]
MILLSFDIEEFDMPMEYDRAIAFEEQIRISVDGTRKILRMLADHHVKATFFCTAKFALSAPEIIYQIVDEGHELASHGYFHSRFSNDHLLSSKITLEKISGQQIFGFRMPRMMAVNNDELQKAGYEYNSSTNPTWLPGRYNNLGLKRTIHQTGKLFQLPASVTPLFRIPLFWLSFHNFPLWLYKILCELTYFKDRYLNIYFHPWEFTDLNDKEKFGFPGYVSRNSGSGMLERMDNLITDFKSKGYEFGTISEMLKIKEKVSEKIFAI